MLQSTSGKWSEVKHAILHDILYFSRLVSGLALACGTTESKNIVHTRYGTYRVSSVEFAIQLLLLGKVYSMCIIQYILAQLEKGLDFFPEMLENRITG